VSATLALTILAVAAVLVVVFLIASANRRRSRVEDVPPGMRPAYSDEELERTVLERYMQWGMVLTVGLALFLPGYWLLESRSLQGATQNFFTAAIARGEEQYVANCATCHSENLGGGAAPVPGQPGESWPAPALNDIVARYADSENVTDVRDLILTTLHRGRPGTPMPTWGAAYGGPMTDQQIEDITTYILANQVEETAEANAAVDLSGEELFNDNCAKCHGENLAGGVGPSLIGVTERHSRETILGILQGGILRWGQAVMPAFGEDVYQYVDGSYTDDALNRIVDYLEECQPADLPEDALGYQTPGLGEQEQSPSACGQGAAAAGDGASPAPDASASPDGSSADATDATDA
jgi:mono/diheme cytochrome c family protein